MFLFVTNLDELEINFPQKDLENFAQNLLAICRVDDLEIGKVLGISPLQSENTNGNGTNSENFTQNEVVDEHEWKLLKLTSTGH